MTSTNIVSMQDIDKKPVASCSDMEYQVNTPSSCTSEEQANVEEYIDSMDWGISHTAEQSVHPHGVGANNNKEWQSIQVKAEIASSDVLPVEATNDMEDQFKLTDDAAAFVCCMELLDVVEYYCATRIAEQLDDMLVAMFGIFIQKYLTTPGSIKSEKDKQKAIPVIEIPEEPIEPDAVLVKTDPPQTMIHILKEILKPEWSQDNQMVGVHKFLLDLGRDIVVDSVSAQIGLNRAKIMKTLVQRHVLSDAEEEEQAECKEVLKDIELLRRKISKRCPQLDRSKWHKCKHCDFKTDLDTVLKYHENDPHQNDSNKFICTYCIDSSTTPLFKSASVGSLGNHAATKHHIRMNPYPAVTKHACPYCTYDSNHPANFFKHVSFCRLKFKLDANLAPPPGFTPALAIPVKRYMVNNDVMKQLTTGETTEENSKIKQEDEEKNASGVSEEVLFAAITRILNLVNNEPEPTIEEEQPASQFVHQSSNGNLLIQPLMGTDVLPAGQPKFIRVNQPQLQAAGKKVNGPARFQLIPLSGGATRMVTTTAIGQQRVKQILSRGVSPVHRNIAPVGAMVSATSRQQYPILLTSGASNGAGFMRMRPGAVTNIINNRKRPMDGSVTPDMMRKRVVISTITCEICHCALTTVEVYSKHLSTSHRIWLTAQQLSGRPPLICRLCPVRFHTGPALQKHLAGAHGIPPRVNNVYNRTMEATRPQLAPRLSRPFAAQRMQQLPPQTPSAGAAAAAHSKALVYKCSLCSHSFPSESAVVTHLKFFHKILPKDSPAAGKSKPGVNDQAMPTASAEAMKFVDRGAVTSSKVSGNELALNPCELCDSSFLTVQGRLHHYRNKHLKQASVPLVKSASGKDVVEISGASIKSNESMKAEKSMRNGD